MAEYVCRSVRRSIAADSCQCGRLAHVRANKTTARMGAVALPEPMPHQPVEHTHLLGDLGGDGLEIG